MAETNNEVEFTSSQEQLEVAALVNRFVGLKFGDFDPDIHVEEARKIVKFLDPKITLSRKAFPAEIEYFGPSSRETKSSIRGVTDLGEIETTIRSGDKGEPTAKMLWGKQREYRTGVAIVTKTKNRDQSVVLKLKHFLRHGPTNRAIGKFTPYWTIVYDPKTLELLVITEIRTVVKNINFKLPFKLGSVSPVNYIVDTPVVVWKAPANK